MSDTHTATMSLYGGDAVTPIGLILVHHPGDPSLVGRRWVVEPGQRLELGRSSPVLGEGVLEDRRISRRHVAISRLGDELTVWDLKSRNGTWIDGQQVKQGPLKPGQVLGVGQLLFVVQHLPEGDLPEIRAPLVGISPALQQALDRVAKVSRHDLPVLILGESGTGKELIAREVHRCSGRDGRFVAVNCAGVSDTLLQSELFGHTRGAFSGAETARRGLVEQARDGSLFLDEIGDSSLSLQASLLRLLQEKEIRPVGSDRTVKVDVRFVAATNRIPSEEVRTGRFREDLYARLNRVVIWLPALRERPEDILPLALHFASTFAGHGIQLSHGLAQALLIHDWPGNARALQGVMERLVIEFEDEDVMPQPSWLEDELALHARAGQLAESLPPEVPNPSVASVNRDEVGPELLRELLIKHRGNVTRVATDLGMGRNTVYRKMRRWGIDLDELRTEIGDPI